MGWDVFGRYNNALRFVPQVRLLRLSKGLRLWAASKVPSPKCSKNSTAKREIAHLFVTGTFSVLLQDGTEAAEAPGLLAKKCGREKAG